MADADDTRMATFQIDARSYRRLIEVAERDERSLSAVLRLAVRDYLRKHDREKAA